MNSNFSFHLYEPAAWIQVSGNDASSYLQSQFSNNLSNLTPGESKYGFFLNRKGKIQFDAFLIEAKPSLWFLYSYFCPEQQIISILEKNIIADDVILSPFSQITAGISLWGTLPPLDKVLFSPQLIPIGGLRSQNLNYDLLFPKEMLNEVEVYFSALGGAPATLDDQEKERIQSSIPAIPFDLNEENFPQEGGMEKLAVCVNKGCYLGQEVMMRLHTQGSVRKKTYKVEFECPGEAESKELFSGDKPAGLLKSYFIKDNTCTGLALLKESATEDLTIGEKRIPVRILGISDLNPSHLRVNAQDLQTHT